MDRLLCTRFNIQSVPESYIVPPENRATNLIVPSCRTFPVVDLGGEDGWDRMQITQQILEAIQEFGFFQVINHGISEKTIHDMLSVAKELFQMPVGEQAKFYSEDPNLPCRLYTSINYDKEEIHYWKDVLRHPNYPVEESIHLWPEKPIRYREVVGRYSIEVRKLGVKLLELISEGLGLELKYFTDELSLAQSIAINHYPPCPAPNLTLGLLKHCDPNLITLLSQGNVNGLQVFKDGQWIAFEPLPNAFVVNMGLLLQIISNGKLKSAEHRAVTNSSVTRISVGTFISASMDSIIEPVPLLVNASSPALYRAFKCKELIANYRANALDSEATLRPFKLQSQLSNDT